jgi:hypothetical protein
MGEQRLRASAKGLLKRIFENKVGEKRAWRELCNKGVRIWEMGNAYEFLVRKPKAKRPLGRPRRRWESIVTCMRDCRRVLD